MKTILVTGGTRGIGRGIVDALVAKHADKDFCLSGFRLLVTYRSNSSQARELSAYLTEKGVDHELLALDLADRASVNDLVGCIAQTYGQIDALINNAGMADDGSFLTMRDATFCGLIKSNLVGTIYLTEKLLEKKCLSLSGAVVFTASAAGVYGKEGQVGYATTKGGIIGYTQLLARRFSASGLRANAVAPGFIETDMVKELDPSMFEHTLSNTSMAAMGKVEDVASIVLYLLNPGYIQATTIKVDGGQLR